MADDHVLSLPPIDGPKRRALVELREQERRSRETKGKDQVALPRTGKLMIDTRVIVRRVERPDVVVGELSLSAASYVVDENAATQIVINRVGGFAEAVSVDWTITSATVTPSSGTATFQIGNGQAVIAIVAGDIVATENGSLTLSNPQNLDGGLTPTLVSPSTATFTVTNLGTGQSMLALSLAAYSGNENTIINFVIDRTEDNSDIVSVDWVITGATVIPLSGTATFNIGVDTSVVPVAAGLVVATEVGALALSNPQNLSGGVIPAIISPSSATFTVTDVPISAAVRAFPGAEGLAANTRGAAGYSGTPNVEIVTSLANSGTGSLRNAIAGSGKEGTFVTFEVSGIINLTSLLAITSDFTTIAFQTSPGGVCIAGYPIQYGNSSNHTENHIVRHHKGRAGSHEAGGGSDNEAFRIWNASYVMADHCSWAWGGDEVTSMVDTSGNPSAMNTWNKCLITQSIENAGQGEPDHNYGTILSCSNRSDNSLNMHRCAYLHHRRRMPMIQGNAFIEMSNCITYNWDRFYNTVLQSVNNPGQNMQWNHISNFAEGGPNGSGAAGEMNGHTSMGSSYELLFMENNFGEQRTVTADNEWCITNYNTGNLLTTAWQRSTRWPRPAGGVDPAVEELLVNKVTAKAQALAWLADCGATKPFRDSHDDEMVASFDAETSLWLADTVYPDDWPIYADPPPPPDSNDDGIPDDWTAANMGGAIWSDTAPSGYLWIEEYVNSIA